MAAASAGRLGARTPPNLARGSDVPVNTPKQLYPSSFHIGRIGNVFLFIQKFYRAHRTAHPAKYGINTVASKRDNRQESGQVARETGQSAGARPRRPRLTASSTAFLLP